MAFFKANILDESNVFSIGLASKRETRKTACSIWNDGLWPHCTSINMLVWYYQHYKEQGGWKISLQTTTDLSQAYSLPVFNFSLNGTIKLPLFFCFPHGYTTRSLIIPVLLSGIWVFYPQLGWFTRSATGPAEPAPGSVEHGNDKIRGKRDRRQRGWAIHIQVFFSLSLVEKWVVGREKGKLWYSNGGPLSKEHELKKKRGFLEDNRDSIERTSLQKTAYSPSKAQRTLQSGIDKYFLNPLLTEI